MILARWRSQGDEIITFLDYTRVAPIQQNPISSNRLTCRSSILGSLKSVCSAGEIVSCVSSGLGLFYSYMTLEECHIKAVLAFKIEPG
ncbi:hypothetical protein MASR1M12_31010 [Erysipelotrichia bacterium]